MQGAFGILLCVLLCLFAVGAKTGVYRPEQQQVKTLTCAKMWQDHDVKSIVQAIPMHAALLLAFALWAFPQPKLTSCTEPEPVSFGISTWLGSPLSVRPPPAI